MHTAYDKTKLVNKSLISAQPVHCSSRATLEKIDSVITYPSGSRAYLWQGDTSIDKTVSFVEHYRRRLDDYMGQRDRLKQYSDYLRQETLIDPHIH